MLDPIDGRHGSLLMSGWIGGAPTGNDEAFILLTTPDDRAPATMRLIAEMIGARIDQPGTRIPPVYARFELDADDWIHLRVGDADFTRPMTPEWSAVARERHQAVLVLGLVPTTSDIDSGEYVDRYGDDCVVALIDMA